MLVFLDAILVYSKDIGSYVQYLRKNFELLVANRFVVNKKKCDFVVDKVEYLGHIVSATSISTDPKRIEAMLN